MTGGIETEKGGVLAITAPCAIRTLGARADENSKKAAPTCDKKAKCLCHNGIWTALSMAEKSAEIPGSPKRKRGRPSRQEAAARAMATFAIDPSTVDPLAVLAAIMMNPALPASARVQAARALIAARNQDPAEDSAAISDLASRAIRLMAARKAH